MILDELERTGCFGQDGWNMQRHRYFAEKLETLSVKYPGKISGPCGEGMMMAFTPGNGSGDDAKIMVQRLYDNGLMSFVAGAIQPAFDSCHLLGLRPTSTSIWRVALLKKYCEKVLDGLLGLLSEHLLKPMKDR